MTAIQQCTAMVKGGGLFPRPCGEPVAELGLCRVLLDDLSPAQGRQEYCNAEKEIHPLIFDHEYQGRLVHVILGSCEECGHAEDAHHGEGFYDEVTEPEHRPSKPVCEFCSIERLSRTSTRHLHDYAPTVTELDVGHEAVSDGN